MQLNLPYQYEAIGIRPRKRNISSVSGYDNVSVTIRDVDKNDFVEVLSLNNNNGHLSEVFYYFEGTFWIRNSRGIEDEFSAPHCLLLGEWPCRTDGGVNIRNRYTGYYSATEATLKNRRTLRSLSEIGILNHMVIGDWISSAVGNDLELRSPFIRQGGAIVCTPVVPDEALREVHSDTKIEEMNKAIEYALDNVIAVDGEVYHRVSEPIIYVTEDEINWCFSSNLKPLLDPIYASNTQDTRIAEAYRLPMSEFASVPSMFPKMYNDENIGFTITNINPHYFGNAQLSMALNKDIELAMDMRSGLGKETTAFIYKWCELRDLVESNSAAGVEQDDDFFDQVAEIIVSLESLTANADFPGARLWLNRSMGVNSSAGVLKGP